MELRTIPHTPEQLKILKASRVGFTAYWGCGAVMGTGFLAFIAQAIGNIYFWALPVTLGIILVGGAIRIWVVHTNDLQSGKVICIAGKVSGKRAKGSRSRQYFIRVDTYEVPVGRAHYEKTKVGDQIKAVHWPQSKVLVEYEILN